MTFVAAAIAATAVVGGSLISANGAKSAANTQAQSASEATAAQRAMFDKQIALQQPWHEGGVLGLNKLLYLAGLSPTGVGNSGGGGTGGGALETADQIRNRLAPQFAPRAELPTQQTYPDEATAIAARFAQQYAPQAQQQQGNPGLDAAVQAELQRQQQQQQQATTTAQTDPSYGSLLHKFGLSDFQADPGYAFRQSEGEKGLQRAASAAGGLGSGKYLKDAMSFNQGLATDEFGKAYDRFNNDQGTTFNRLASLSGVGQTSANNIGAAAQNFGNNSAANILGAGNARAAGMVGGANAINGGISQGVGMYQQQNMLNRFFPQGAGVPQTPYSFNGGGGFGTGSLYGNQDYGQYL